MLALRLLATMPHLGCWPSPLGALVLHLDDDGALIRLDLPLEGVPRPFPWTTPPRADGRFAHVTEQLDDYFAGRRTIFSVPLRLYVTNFQQRVYQELQRIPAGTTITYGELARRVGRPGGAQAVGQANRHNPVPIVVPCHRVVASNGALGGYAGNAAGADRCKRFLLELEGAL